MVNIALRKLHERSYLLFEFPTRGNEITRTYIPMLENCKVSENQKSNLAEYSLLGRSGSIFSYLGAKSRSFNLSFNITFQHLVDMYSYEGISRRFEQSFKLFSRDDRESFFDNDQKTLIGINHYKNHSEFFKSLVSEGESLNSPLFNINKSRVPDDLVFDQKKEKLINLVIFWINLIRSSVRNNASNTLYGAPIVRLNHGIMYNNIPCIADNFSISFNEEAGYDFETLLPKQLEISMSLNEQRVGNLDKFESREVVLGDNIAGWESVISENNMDPYNGMVGAFNTHSITRPDGLKSLFNSLNLNKPMKTLF